LWLIRHAEDCTQLPRSLGKPWERCCLLPDEGGMPGLVHLARLVPLQPVSVLFLKYGANRRVHTYYGCSL